MVAIPGAFCEAIVTRNNGSAMLILWANEKCGVINAGITGDRLTSLVTMSPFIKAMAIPTNIAAITAYLGAITFSTNHATSILPHKISSLFRLLNACKPKRSKIPANMADASEWGMIFIRRANSPVTPHSTISALATIKTPMAS